MSHHERLLGAVLAVTLSSLCIPACGEDNARSSASGKGDGDGDNLNGETADGVPGDFPLEAYTGYCDEDDYVKYDVYVGCGLERYIDFWESYTLIYSDRETGEEVYRATFEDTDEIFHTVLVDETGGVPECDSWERLPCRDPGRRCAILDSDYRCEMPAGESFDARTGCDMTLTQTYFNNGETLIEYVLHRDTSPDLITHSVRLIPGDRCEVYEATIDAPRPYCNEDWVPLPCPEGTLRIDNNSGGAGGAAP